MLTDEELLARAEAAGWTWCEDAHGVASESGSFTGWLHGSKENHNTRTHVQKVNKYAYLRGHAAWQTDKYNPGFDHKIDCHVCGKPVWLNWLADKAKELMRMEECHKCNHWMGLHRSGNSLVIEEKGVRTHYQVGRAKAPTSYNGFGGSWFYILHDDGTWESTCDLMCQGIIPDMLHYLFPINAVFVSEWTYQWLERCNA